MTSIIRGRTLAVAGTLVAIQGLALLAYLAVERDRQGFAAERLARRPAPELVVEHQGGQVAPVAWGNRAVLIHFWATWCPPCRDELPGLLATSRHLGRELSFELMAVAVKDDWASLRQFLDGTIPAEVVLDRMGSHQRYGVVTLPATYLVASDGKLLLRVDGPRDWRSSGAEMRLRRELKPHQ